MRNWLSSNFNYPGLTSRTEYRRWLPLIVAVQIADSWAVFRYGTHGMLNFSIFGWPGLGLFAIITFYFVCWLCLTARRLRAAQISRSWLILSVIPINIPLGEYFYLNISSLVVPILILVATFAPDKTKETVA